MFKTHSLKCLVRIPYMMEHLVDFSCFFIFSLQKQNEHIQVEKNIKKYKNAEYIPLLYSKIVMRFLDVM